MSQSSEDSKPTFVKKQEALNYYNNLKPLEEKTQQT